MTSTCHRYMANAKFFDEHPDPGRPCYTHICYPSKEEPFYTWRERFLVDKCCQFEGNDIVYGSELVLKGEDDLEDGCSDSLVVKCQLPLDNDAPLIPVVQVQFRSIIWN